MLFGKDAEEMKAKFAEVDTRFTELTHLIKKLDEKQEKKLTALEQRFDMLSLSITSELAKIPEHVQAIQKAREDVEKSTRAFTELQRRIEQFVTGKLGDIIRESVNTLKTDTERYISVKKEIESLVAMARQFGDEVAKFKELSVHVQKVDFDLVKSARELSRTDTEKVKLMKEVDELQRLVARMRREHVTH